MLDVTELPQEWKTAYIPNRYKKGDSKQCSNYRGISVSFKTDGKIVKNRIETV